MEYLNHSEICPVCKGSGKYRHEQKGLTSVTYYETTWHRMFR